MIKITIQIFCLFTVLFVVSCGGNQSDRNGNTPLPVAWHRLPIEYSDTMKVLEDMPVPVAVNRQATFEVEEIDPPGLTVRYPEVGADIYFTFVETPPGTDCQKIIEGRQERISLNLNGVPARTFHTPEGEDNDGVLVVATSGTQTPVQLLVNMPEYVVTATAFLHDPRVSVAYDSIKPLIEVLKYDMSHALPGVKFEEAEK